MSGLKPFRFIVVVKALIFTGTIAKAQATFYDGKTVTVIVNAGEGVHKAYKKTPRQRYQHRRQKHPGWR